MATGAALALLLCAVFALQTLTEGQQEGDEACLKTGGICLVVEDCPPGSLSNTTGLCPRQGHECCHGLSMSERRCNARGGICRQKAKCGRSLWDEHAKDCASGETCCTLVT